jgi:hypothetical protein
MLTRHIEGRKKGREDRGAVRGGQMNELRSKPKSNVGAAVAVAPRDSYGSRSSTMMSRRHYFDFSSSSKRSRRSRILSRDLL